LPFLKDEEDLVDSFCLFGSVEELAERSRDLAAGAGVEEEEDASELSSASSSALGSESAAT